MRRARRVCILFWGGGLLGVVDGSLSPDLVSEMGMGGVDGTYFTTV